MLFAYVLLSPPPLFPQMAAIYLYVDPLASREERPDNDFGVKVAIHEYAHLLQQGFLTRQITSTAPVNVNQRFIVKNYGNVDLIFATKVKAAMDALPADYTLVPIPTLIVLIPMVAGGVGSSILAASVAEIMELQFDVSSGCPGVDFTIPSPGPNENNAMAEGAAEYYSMNVLTPAVVSGWSVPFQSVQQWTYKMNEAYAQMAGGKATFHVADGSSLSMSALENSAGWSQNTAGELVYAYLIEQWRPQTTQKDLFEIWMQAACVGYSAAFEAKMGSKWSAFVCAMEDYYKVNGDSACVPNSAWDLGWISSHDLDSSNQNDLKGVTNPACPYSPAAPVPQSCAELGWTNLVNNVCGESDDKLGSSGASSTCNTASFTDAGTVCAEAGARLCTTDELDSGVTAGTGCNFDTQYIWTSTWCGLGPEGGKFYVSVGGGGSASDRKCKNPKKVYPVRCCSDTDVSIVSAVSGTTTTTFPFLSDRKSCASLGWEVTNNACGESDKAFKKGADKCFTNKNHPDAERKCLKLGGRMCSQADIEAGVGKSTGCGFDSQFLWTSTPCGASSYIQAKGNGDGSTQCEVAKAKGPMRCCSDVVGPITVPRAAEHRKIVAGNFQASATDDAGNIQLGPINYGSAVNRARQSNAKGFAGGAAITMISLIALTVYRQRRSHGELLYPTDM